MELINQSTKKIMEGCKERAREAGLSFQDESLEYIVTNRDLLELTPKYMIPTMYDYWVHDIEVLREKGRYELYPNNPYETVINTRPAISFYNDNNPDWLNVMIFYHVLGHIDFFQNNANFRLTWDFDFTGQALSDKRLIARLRAEKGRWVDYIIEFTRGIDNLVGFHHELGASDPLPSSASSRTIDYYFDVFLQTEKKVSASVYLKEIERYNACLRDNAELAEQIFLSEVNAKNPEFEPLFHKYSTKKREREHGDLVQHIMKHSSFLNRSENTWMKSVIEVVRNTSLYFQPQIRTKLMHEGWASFWHERLFLSDSRIKGHEVDFARVNAGVTALSRVGLNPYAIGMRLFEYIHSQADKGRRTLKYMMMRDSQERKDFDTKSKGGMAFLFDLRRTMSDYLFVQTFIDQDFVDKHNLFVTGKRLNRDKNVWEYYVKSRSAEDYRAMVSGSLYHPPLIEIGQQPRKGDEGWLNLVHRFEGKPLVKEFVANTLLGIEFLWGAPVTLETSEPEADERPRDHRDDDADVSWKQVLYTMKGRKLSKEER